MYVSSVDRALDWRAGGRGWVLKWLRNEGTTFALPLARQSCLSEQCPLKAVPESVSEKVIARKLFRFLRSRSNDELARKRLLLRASKMARARSGEKVLWRLTRSLYPQLVTLITTCMVLNPLTIEFGVGLALVCWTVYLIIPYLLPSSPWFCLKKLM